MLHPFTSDFFMTATISSKKALDLISFICSAKEHVPSWWSPKSSWLDPVLLQPNVRSKALADDGSSAGRWAGPRSHSSCRVDCAWNLPHPATPPKALKYPSNQNRNVLLTPAPLEAISLISATSAVQSAAQRAPEFTVSLQAEAAKLK